MAEGGDSGHYEALVLDDVCTTGTVVAIRRSGLDQLGTLRAGCATLDVSIGADHEATCRCPALPELPGLEAP